MLNFPSYSFKIKTVDGSKMIFDRLRKKYVALQPEEWVRQHMVEYLLGEKKYPAALMGNEVALSCNGLKKRCDTVVYSSAGSPLMLIEYKAPTVEITQATFDQIAVYNTRMKVDYLLVSNGLRHFCCQINRADNTLIFLADIPDYDELKCRG